MEKYRVEEQGTHSFLVYSLEPAEEIDEVGYHMVSGNEIPNLLPVSLYQLDQERELKYNISSKMRLNEFLEQTISKQKALNVFRSVCEALLSSEEYMLNEKQFVLDMHYIFVEPETGETELVYLAVENEETGPEMDCARFFKQVLIKLKSGGDDRNYVADILQYLNTSGSFSLHTFRELLLKLDGGEPPTGEKPIKEPLKPAKHQPKKPADKKLTHPPAVKPLVTGGGSSSEELPESKEKHPERGFDIPGGGGRSFDIPGGGTVKEEPAKKQPENGKMGLMYLLHNFSGENLKKYNEQRSEEKSRSPKKPKKGKKKTLVLVSLNEAYPYVWTVTKERFMIGRRSTNDGSLASVSKRISREHCVVEKENDCYYVVDLNSKVGTIVDGAEYHGSAQRALLQDASIIELPDIMFRAEFR